MTETYLNPHWLREVGAAAPATGFIVYAIAYPRNDGSRRAPRAWAHRSFRAAHRRLGSVCAGKLRERAEHAAFIMDAAGAVFSWNHAKEILAK